MIQFTDLTFLFRFLPIFLILYYLFPVKHRDMLLLLGSLFFYAVGEPLFVLLLIVMTVINYLIGKKSRQLIVGHSVKKWKKKIQKKYLIFAVIIDVLVLAASKGLSVFVDNSLLPMGISFYIFKMISYQADIYRNEIEEEVSFKTTALYFTIFPQVISGPVMRYGEGDFSIEKRFSLEQFEEGLFYFVSGLAMKVLLADRIAILWNDLQMIGFQSISTPLAWLGIFSYSLQLYFDFWGYSLMASGIMMLLGFEFIQNFHHPYAARSISEFYRRWHMTLGSFFRDYVYIPMGGSRCSKIIILRNLAIVWLLTGIWHGNGLNFIIWGLVLGLFIIMEKIAYGKRLSQIPVIGNLYVLFVIPLTWMIFAISDLSQMAVYFGRLFPIIGGSGIAVNPQDIFKYLQTYGPLFGICVLFCIPAVFDWMEEHKKNIFVLLFMTAVFWLSVYFVVSMDGNPFMYFKF